MANLQDIIKQLMQQGMIDPAVNKKNNALQQSIAALAAAQKADPKTMAGFALGKLLRQGFDTWKDNYDARGDINNRLMGMPEEQRNAELAEMEKLNPKRAAYVRQHLAKKLGQMNPAAQDTQINDKTTSRLANQFADGGVNLDWSGQNEGNGLPPLPWQNRDQRIADALAPYPQSQQELLDFDKMVQSANEYPFAQNDDRIYRNMYGR